MADYYNKRLPPRIQPMQQIGGLRNEVSRRVKPGTYGYLNEPYSTQGGYQALRDKAGPEWNRLQDQKAQEARESAEFFKSSPGRKSGMKMHRFPTTQALARSNYSFAMATKGWRSSTQPGRKAAIWKALGDNPNTNKLSQKEVSEYASLKVPSGLGQKSGGLTQARWDRERLGELEAKLFPKMSFSQQVAKERAERIRRWKN